MPGLLDKISGGVTDFSSQLQQYLASPEGQIAAGLLAAGRPQTTPTQAGGNIGPAIQNVLNQQAQRGLFQAQSINQLAQAGRGPKPQETFTPLTDEEEKALQLDPNKAYQKSDLSGKVSQIGGGGQTINVGGDTKLDRGVATILQERSELARSARTSKRAASRALSLLDSEAGVNTGIFAPLKDATARLLDGLAGGDDASNSQALQAFANSQDFEAAGGVLVGQIIKLFGSGTGLSDADREFAIKIAGALRKGTVAGLKQILSERVTVADRDIQEFNDLIGSFSEDPAISRLFPKIKTDDDVQRRIDAL
jgi:hypothetical protein